MKLCLKDCFGAQDMTKNSPYENLLRFSVPLLIGNLVQQLYNTADSIIVGHFVGDEALAAVGAAGPMVSLMLVLFTGIATGAGVMVSQYFGAKNSERLSRTVGNTLLITVLAALLVTAAGTTLSYPVLKLLSTPETIIAMTNQYLVIYFFGFVGFAFYNMIAGILRAMGDSIVPLIYLILSCGLNIGLDLVFVGALSWGVAGVAWSTVAAQGISALLCLRRLLRMRRGLRLKPSSLVPDRDISYRIIALGLPSGLTQMVFAMASVVVQSLTNSFGTVAIAAVVIVMRVDGFAMLPTYAFGSAMTTFSGQNMGAGYMRRVDQGMKAGMRLSLATAAILSAAVLIFAKPLIRLFTATQELAQLALQMLWIVTPGYLAVAITQTLLGVMRGAGDTMGPMWVSVLTTIVIRVPLAYGIAYFTRSPQYPAGMPHGLVWSLLASWIIGAVMAAALYRKGRWRAMAVTKNKKMKTYPTV